MNDLLNCPITHARMTDPVIDNEGVSYERAAIVAWLRQGHATSPVTRRPLHEEDLKPNLALRAILEGPTPTSTPTPAVPSTPPPIQLTVTHNDDLYHVQLRTRDADPIPTDFILVLDNSGSMGSSCMDSTTNADAARMSRSDLVRHSVATLIELAAAPHGLGVVLFDDRATVALPVTELTSVGKQVAKTVLPLITPSGGTNIWTGLVTALTEAAKPEREGRNVVILLQTDGESDPRLDPPRGIPDTFRSWIDSHPAVAARTTVHTVGYGYGQALDMPLLRQIATIGGGHCNYIPDGSMVGTVFIHNIANMLSCVHRGVVVTVPELGVAEPVGFLQAGQPRDILLRIPQSAGPVTVCATNTMNAAVSVSVDPATTVTGIDPFVLARDAFLRGVTAALGSAEPASHLDATHAELTALAVAATDPVAVNRITALLTDLRSPERHRGQIEKALSDPDACRRWGRHYVPAVLDGHRSQWAINFKDEGSKIYGGPLTRRLIQEGDEVFVRLPPPTPTGAAAAPVSMASTHSSVGPCFLPASLVLMGDRTHKRCDEIRAGDYVITNGGITRVRCVIRTEVSHADIVRMHTGTNASPHSEGGFTMWHPVYVDNRWQYPADLGPVTRVATDAIYNFVLDGGHILSVCGTLTCTMGHNFKGPVIGHPYFGAREPGKRNIRDDLEADPGWSTGLIVWRNLSLQRDPQTGFITGYTSTV